MTMTDIATKVESLAGACRDTDAAIWFALGACPHIETKREGYQDDTGHRCVACGADSWGNRNSFGQKLYDREPAYTASLDAVREAFPYLCVSASDIGADGLALVRLVPDTSANPIVEHVGIASRLEHAWLAAALRAKASALPVKDGGAAS